MDFNSLTVNGLPLMVIVMGIVSVLKKFGISGNALFASSLGTGLIMGILYQVSIAVPVGFTQWFGVAIFGVGLGIVTSGAYDVIKSIGK